MLRPTQQNSDNLMNSSVSYAMVAALNYLDTSWSDVSGRSRMRGAFTRG
jgi:hypothetical protein